MEEDDEGIVEVGMVFMVSKRGDIPIGLCMMKDVYQGLIMSIFFSSYKTVEGTK